jgi:ABC-2 type transport system ATP-binding protein
MTSFLQIENLHKRYRTVHALRGVNLELPGPGIYGLLGPNGAGKTTAIKLIAGLIKPTEGRIRISGIDIRDDPVRALASIGVMMEMPRFYDHLSGGDNLRVLALLSGQRDQRRADQLMDRVGLSAKAGEKVSAYSRGMRQRLGLAAALLDDPRLVILDEPTNGLDPAGIAEFRQWLPQMAHEEQRAILLSSHQMGEMERICDNFTIVSRGTIVATGKAADLAQPRTSVVFRVPDAEAALAALHDVQGITNVEVLGADRIRADSPAAPTAAINRILVNRGIDVIEITEERESLEEIFFRLVGRDHDVA